MAALTNTDRMASRSPLVLYFMLVPIHINQVFFIKKNQSINQSKHISIAPCVASESEAVANDFLDDDDKL